MPAEESEISPHRLRRGAELTMQTMKALSAQKQVFNENVPAMQGICDLTPQMWKKLSVLTEDERQELFSCPLISGREEMNAVTAEAVCNPEGFRGMVTQLAYQQAFNEGGVPFPKISMGIALTQILPQNARMGLFDSGIRMQPRGWKAAAVESSAVVKLFRDHFQTVGQDDFTLSELEMPHARVLERRQIHR